MATDSKKPAKTMHYKADPTVADLAPSFKRRVDVLIERMAARGFEAVPIDAWRTIEQAAANAAKGTGIIDSLHCYGVCCDFVEQSKGWSNPKFYEALGQEAKKLGVTWGGRWTKPDRAHCQAIPVGWQYLVRKAKNAQQINDVCERWLRQFPLSVAANTPHGDKPTSK